MSAKTQERAKQDLSNLLTEFDYVDIIDASRKQIMETMDWDALRYKSTIEALERSGDIIKIEHPEERRSMLYFTKTEYDGITLKDSGLRFCLTKQADNTWAPERHKYHADSDRVECSPLPPSEWAIKAKSNRGRKPGVPNVNKNPAAATTAGYKGIVEHRDTVIERIQKNDDAPTYEENEEEPVPYEIPKVKLIKKALITLPNGTTMDAWVGQDSKLYTEDAERICENSKAAITAWWHKNKKPLAAWELEDRGVVKKKTRLLGETDDEVTYLVVNKTRQIVDAYGIATGQKFPTWYASVLVYCIVYVCKYTVEPVVNWYRHQKKINAYVKEERAKIKELKKLEKEAEKRADKWRRIQDRINS